MSTSTGDFTPIRETIEREWGTIYVSCAIPSGDPTLEPNLRVAIRANAMELMRPEDKGKLQDAIGQSYEDVRLLRVIIVMKPAPEPAIDDFHGSDASVVWEPCTKMPGTCNADFPESLCAAIHLQQESARDGNSFPFPREVVDGIHS